MALAPSSTLGPSAPPPSPPPHTASAAKNLRAHARCTKRDNERSQNAVQKGELTTAPKCSLPALAMRASTGVQAAASCSSMPRTTQTKFLSSCSPSRSSIPGADIACDRTCSRCNVMRPHTSHVTRHTSHVTRHTARKPTRRHNARQRTNLISRHITPLTTALTLATSFSSTAAADRHVAWNSSGPCIAVTPPQARRSWRATSPCSRSRRPQPSQRQLSPETAITGYLSQYSDTGSAVRNGHASPRGASAAARLRRT